MRIIGWAAAIGAFVGAAVGVAVLTYGSGTDHWVAFLLCPSSMGGMALEGEHGIWLSIPLAMIVAENALLYALLLGFFAAILTPE